MDLLRMDWRDVGFVHWPVDPETVAANFDATYGPAADSETHRSGPGTLESFLVSRYRFYVADGGGTIYYADIGHEPWPLQEGTVEIRRNDLFSANGFEEPSSEPIVHYSPGTSVTAGRLHRL